MQQSSRWWYCWITGRVHDYRVKWGVDIGQVIGTYDIVFAFVNREKVQFDEWIDRLQHSAPVFPNDDHPMGSTEKREILTNTEVQMTLFKYWIAKSVRLEGMVVGDEEP